MTTPIGYRFMMVALLAGGVGFSQNPGPDPPRLPQPPPAKEQKERAPDAAAKKKKETPLDLKDLGTCGVIDMSRAPAGALFETKVLGSRNLTWVERSQVDKVVRELELQALFSPEGGSSRAGLGKLLKADLLVMLRAGQKPGDPKAKHIEIVICECQRGLRVSAERVPLTDKDQDTVGAMEAVLDGALAKLRQKIVEVCAVPPFINNDLDRRYDWLKASCARAVEIRLLKHKGILLVETAEAKAFAKEALLAGQAGALERRLPLYLLGSYRTKSPPGERRPDFTLVELTVTLQRGEKELGVQRQEVSLLDSSKAFDKMVEALMEKVRASGDQVDFDPRAEFQQLVKRAESHERLGNWSECLELFETALLLDNGQTELRFKAARACGQLIEQKRQIVRNRPAEATAMLQLYRRGLEHLELDLRPTAKRMPPREPNQRPFRGSPLNYSHILDLRLVTLSKEQVQLLLDVVKEHRAAMLRICKAHAEAGIGDEHRFLGSAVSMMPLPQRYPLVKGLIQELKDLPHTRKRTYYFTQTLDVTDGEVDAQYDAFLVELSADPHPEIRAGALDLKKQRDAILASAKKQAEAKQAEAKKPAKKAAPDEPNPLVFQPVPLTFGTSKTTGKPAGLGLRDCLALGPKLDFMVGNSAAFLMREKDTLKTMKLDTVQHYCYDGRFVWFSVSKANQEPQLYVYDPAAGKGWAITAKHELPIAGPMGSKNARQRVINMAPLEPGRVLLGGAFGKSYLAIATLDPVTGNRMVKVFHEAPEVALSGTPMQWQRTAVAFEPSRMFVLNGPEGKRRVLILRRSSDHEIEQHPLLVDPETLTVEVMKDKIDEQSLYRGQERDGAAYYLGQDKKLHKIEFPGEKKIAMTGVPFGRFLLLDDAIYVVRDGQLWHGSLAQQQIKQIATMPKGDFRCLVRSSHYGVLVTTWDPDERYRTYRILPPK